MLAPLPVAQDKEVLNELTKIFTPKMAKLTLTFLGTKCVYKKLPFDLLFKEACQLPARY